MASMSCSSSVKASSGILLEDGLAAGGGGTPPAGAGGGGVLDDGGGIEGGGIMEGGIMEGGKGAPPKPFAAAPKPAGPPFLAASCIIWLAKVGSVIMRRMVSSTWVCRCGLAWSMLIMCRVWFVSKPGPAMRASSGFAAIMSTIWRMWAGLVTWAICCILKPGSAGVGK